MKDFKNIKTIDAIGEVDSCIVLVGKNKTPYQITKGNLDTYVNALVSATLTAATDLQIAEVELTAADIIAMNATPVTVVAAPGAGYCLEFVGATFIFDWGNTQFTGGGNVTFQINSNDVSTAVGAVTINAAADSINVVSFLADTTPTAENEAIKITNATAAFAAGDSVVRLKVAYRKHATGL